MVVCGCYCVWLCLSVIACGCVRLCVVVRGCAWLCVVACGCLWLCGCVWLCLVVRCCVWLCVVVCVRPPCSRSERSEASVAARGAGYPGKRACVISVDNTWCKTTTVTLVPLLGELVIMPSQLFAINAWIGSCNIGLDPAICGGGRRPRSKGDGQ